MPASLLECCQSYYRETILTQFIKRCFDHFQADKSILIINSMSGTFLPTIHHHISSKTICIEPVLLDFDAPNYTQAFMVMHKSLIPYHSINLRIYKSIPGLRYHETLHRFLSGTPGLENLDYYVAESSGISAQDLYIRDLSAIIVQFMLDEYTFMDCCFSCINRIHPTLLFSCIKNDKANNVKFLKTCLAKLHYNILLEHEHSYLWLVMAKHMRDSQQTSPEFQ